MQGHWMTVNSFARNPASLDVWRTPVALLVSMQDDSDSKRVTAGITQLLREPKPWCWPHE